MEALGWWVAGGAERTQTATRTVIKALGWWVGERRGGAETEGDTAIRGFRAQSQLVGLTIQK